jgi:dUTP pyrophosphatase
MIKFLLESPDLAPVKGHLSDAGWDLRIAEDIEIGAHGGRVLVSCGVKAEIPEGYAGFIWPRSGLAVKKGLDVLAGLIDAGYRDTIKVALINHGSKTIYFYRGDRIAQLVISPVVVAEAEFVNELSDSERALNGFGSTGIQ